MSLNGITGRAASIQSNQPIQQADTTKSDQELAQLFKTDKPEKKGLGIDHVQLTKMAGGGALIGLGGASILKSVLLTGAEGKFMMPTKTSALYGAALGAGLGLANMETENPSMLKDVAAGALIGTGAGGIVSSAAKFVQSNLNYSTGKVLPNQASPHGVILGASLGAGIGLLNFETSDSNLNFYKNIGAGALMGGSIAGLAEGTIRTLITEAPKSPKLAIIGLGVAVGAGIAMVATKDK